MNASTNINHISVNVPLSPAYESPLYSLNPVRIDIRIPLLEGSHTITTPPTVIGHLRNLPEWPVTGQLTLYYEYDAEQDLVTFCSSDMASDKAIFLTTTLDETAHTRRQSCVQFAYADPYDPVRTHPNWNYCTPSTPGLEDLFRQTVRAANDTIIAQAKKQDVNVGEWVPLPVLSREDFEQLSAVFHKGEFLEYYDPAKFYDSNHSVENVFSIFGKLVKFKNKQAFANVIGSSGDPKIKNQSWIALWESYFGDVEVCASFQFNGFGCNTDIKKIYGGHVILGKVAAPVKYGKDGIVNIIPICENHNNDDHVYMEPIEYDQAVQLDNYHKK